MGLFNKKELRRIEELECELKETKLILDEEKQKNEKLGIYKYEEDPAASFNRTMIAEQYRQSLSMADNTYL